MGGLKRRWWILGLAAATLVNGGCGPDVDREEAVSVVIPASAEEELPHPILDEMEPLVATELADRRAELDGLLADPTIPEVERGRALGRMGQIYQAHRLLEVAEECYRRARRYDPATAAWAYYLGVLASNRGDLDAAASSFEIVSDLEPGDVPTLIRRADLELDRGRIEAAEALYEQALELESPLAAADYGLGRAAVERRDFERAIELFNGVLVLQPSASVVHYHLGLAHRHLGRAEDARKELALSGQVRVAMADPLMQELAGLMMGASTYLTRGNAACREGRFEAGAAEYRRAVEVDPGNLRARQSLASTLLRLGDLDGAVEQFEAAVRIAPTNARAQSDLGAVLAKIDEPTRAVHHLRLAVELQPALENAQLNLANNLMKIGEFDEGMNTYRRILENDPDHLEARSRLGTALAQSGRVREGIVELQSVARRDPGNARVRLNLGVALAEAGDYEGAIAQHLAVLDLNPDSSRAMLTHLNLGTFYVKTGDLDEAEEHYRWALGFDSGLFAAHLDLCEILSARGRLVEARLHCSRAIEIRPDTVAARLLEATALMRLERYSEARISLEASLSALPENLQLRHALARFLAGCPDPRQRDGEKSYSMAAKVFDLERTSPHAETLAMALAEVERFEDAARLQQRIIDQLESPSQGGHRDRLTRNLARYRQGSACCAAPTDILPSP